MSESLHAGYLPLWNPYLNFGLPQYGDMSSGYWSPVTWLIAATVGYNAYSFTLELLLYILLGGLGMYRLTGLWQLNKQVRIIAGVAFMCCGYNAGHLQHFNWISGAAILPWCFWSYLLLLKKNSVKHLLQAVLFFYLLVASAHPGIIISAAYFFVAVFIFHFFSVQGGSSFKEKLRQLFITHAIFALLFLLLAAGLISGYLDILPYFVRGEKISLANALLNPSNARTWISALLPFATVKNNAFFNTDISMRNSYFSLALLLFFLVACFTKKSSWQKFLLVTGGLFALLSMGGAVKTMAYKFLPFMGYVRLNGEFRIFAILCFIIAAAIAADTFFSNKQYFTGAIKYCWYFIEGMLFACIIIGAYKALNERAGVLFSLREVLRQNTGALKLKALVDAISFYDTLWIQGLIQLLIWWGIKWCLKSGNPGLLQKIVVADMVLATLFNVPFTGAGKGSVAAVQAMISQSPKGIPIPVLQPISRIDTFPLQQKEMIGDRSLYNKQIGVSSEVYYPVILKNTTAYFETLQQYPDSNFLQQAFVFTTDKREGGNIAVTQFTPNRIALRVISDAPSQLVLQQNYYPHWWYYHGSTKMEAGKAGISFMAAPVEKGMQDITFSFEPTLIKRAMLLSLIAFVLYCSVLFYLLVKPPSPS